MPQPRWRGWIRSRVAIRRTRETVTCGSPSVSRFRPRPGYSPVATPCHVLPSSCITEGAHTVLPFLGIWIHIRKMHPYLTKPSEPSRCKFLREPCQTRRRSREGKNVGVDTPFSGYGPTGDEIYISGDAGTLFGSRVIFRGGICFYLPGNIVEGRCLD